MDKNQILSEAEKIELLSDDVQEIMGQVPPFIVRWGITVILIIVIGLIAGTFVFKYPDVINSNIVIVSENPPVTLIAHSTGRIQNLIVKNNQFVKAGSTLALLENTAEYNDIKELDSLLVKLGNLFKDNDNIASLSFRGNYKLGSVQEQFSNFHRNYLDYNNFIQLGLYDHKISSLHRQQLDYNRYLQKLNIQTASSKKNVTLSYNQYKRDSILYKEEPKGWIALADIERSEQAYLKMLENYEATLASLSSTQMQINQIGYQIVDLQNQKSEQQHKLQSSLKEALDILIAATADWKQTYVLSAPIDGKVTFTTYWNANQQVVTGDPVFTIVPDKPQRVIAKVIIPILGSGKIERGQRVNIKLDNFPYMEFGMLEGKVENLSLVPVSNQHGTFYYAEASLPNGLITNFKKSLPLNQEMRGTAEIITKDLSLFDRLTQQFRASINK